MTQFEIIDGFVHVPEDLFLRMRDELENKLDLHDLHRAMDECEDVISLESSKRISNGENPVLVYREYRGLSREELAEKAKLPLPLVSRIEGGDEDIAIGAFKSVAKVLEVDLENLF